MNRTKFSILAKIEAYELGQGHELIMLDQSADKEPLKADVEVGVEWWADLKGVEVRNMYHWESVVNMFREGISTAFGSNGERLEGYFHPIFSRFVVY
jgi:hypothetical protein